MTRTIRPSGKSPHAFMREALDVQARLREDRRGLIVAAIAAEADALAREAGYPATAVERYFAERAAGFEAERPQLAALARQVLYSAPAFADLERIYAALEDDDPTLAVHTLASITAAVSELGTRPLRGRPAEEGLRERAISYGRTGYVALYRHMELRGCVLVLAVRHRYAAGYPRLD